LKTNGKEVKFRYNLKKKSSFFIVLYLNFISFVPWCSLGNARALAAGSWGDVGHRPNPHDQALGEPEAWQQGAWEDARHHPSLSSPVAKMWEYHKPNNSMGQIFFYILSNFFFLN